MLAKASLPETQLQPILSTGVQKGLMAANSRSTAKATVKSTHFESFGDNLLESAPSIANPAASRAAQKPEVIPKIATDHGTRSHWQFSLRLSGGGRPVYQTEKIYRLYFPALWNLSSASDPAATGDDRALLFHPPW